MQAAQVAGHYVPLLGSQDTEVFHALLLDTRHRRIRDVRVASGTAVNCPVRPADAFNAAVRERAASVVFVHNHPSGDVSPSPEDRHVTPRLVEAGALLGIRVLDHIIVGRDGGFFSFADHGGLT